MHYLEFSGKHLESGSDSTAIPGVGAFRGAGVSPAVLWIVDWKTRRRDAGATKYAHSSTIRAIQNSWRKLSLNGSWYRRQTFR